MERIAWPCYGIGMLQRRSRGGRKRSRMFNWWVLWRVPVLLLIVMAAWWFGVRPIAHEQGWVRVTQEFGICAERGRSTNACVVDGDTVIIGFGDDRRRIRLTGFDAPELDGACPAESALAITSRDALHEWISRGAFEWNGADDPPYDQYGRELREIRRVDRDGSRQYLASVMLKRELAAESGWGAEPKDWCAG